MSTGTDSLVVFRNSQGLQGRGTLLHLTRDQAVFEVYNPYSIVQLSEVLKDLRILRGDRTIYTGRAVVSNLLPTGLMVIVSATLVDSWSDLAGLPPGEGIREEVASFLRDWESTYALRASYQLAVSNIRAFLGEVSRWLGQIEVVVRPEEPAPGQEQQREFVLDIMEPLTPKLAELFSAFEREAARIDAEEEVSHKAFARREIHPLILCAPFVHRIYTKPLGYAGDYEMVNMMLRDPLEGPNPYAQIINSFYLGQPTAQAHRNRIDMLLERLRSEGARVAAGGGRFRVLNVGCGPAEEIQRLMGQDPPPFLDRCAFDLLDFNRETLDYAVERIEEAKQRGDASPEFDFIHKSIHELLKEAARAARSSSPPSYHLVYCAGLFDYLSDRVCQRLVKLFLEWTVPGGLVVVTNVHPGSPNRYFMEHLAEWYLVYRNQSDMLALAPNPQAARVVADSSGVNVFLDIRKVPS